MQLENERLYGLDEAMLVLGRISRATLYRMRQRGELTFVKIGARTFVRAADLKSLLQSLSPNAISVIGGK